MKSESPPPQVALVVIAGSAYQHWPPLPDVETNLASLVETLTKAGTGYRLCLPELRHGGAKAEIERVLAAWLSSLASTDHVVLYWTGHGSREGNSHFLVTRDSPEAGLGSMNAMSAVALGQALASSPAAKILVLLDTCYSTAGAGEMFTEVIDKRKEQTRPGTQQPYLAVIPSAHALKGTLSGDFVRALSDVLTGADDTLREWSDRDRLVSVSRLSSALKSAMRSRLGATWQAPQFLAANEGDTFLPNPRYRVMPALDVETGRRMAHLPSELGPAVGGVEVLEAGSHFTGRISLLKHLSAWLLESGPGVALLTGRPGSGKSAVLGRLLLPAPRVLAGALEIVKTELPIHAAIHARGQTADGCVRRIAEQLNVELSSDAGDLAASLAQASGFEPPMRIVIDALDESADPIGVAALCRRLGDAGARVLVATRPAPFGPVLRATEAPHSRLHQLFGETVPIFDLDDERSTADDIRDYVVARLAHSDPSANKTDISGAARNVARHADGSFLYARVVVGAFRRAGFLKGHLPPTAIDAFTIDLERRCGTDMPRAEALLAGIAWAAGVGASRSAWPALASAVAERDVTFTEDDIAWALEHLGTYILESQEDGQAVYRLIHQTLAEHYRFAKDPVACHRRITERLAAGLTRLRWLAADPYLIKYLAQHASEGGVLDALIQDPGYLASAEPSGLLRVLHRVTSERAVQIAKIYRGVGDHLANRPAAGRMALLHLAALQTTPALAAHLTPLIESRWKGRWAQWSPSVPHTLAATLATTATAAAVARSPETGPLLVVAAGGALRCIDLTRFMVLPDHVAVPKVKTIASYTADDGSYVVVGTGDGSVSTYSLPRFNVVAVRDRLHPGGLSALTVVGNTDLAASLGADGAVALWRLPELTPIGRRSDVLPIGSALASTTIDGRDIVIAAGDTYRDGKPIAGAAPVVLLSVPDLATVSSFGRGIAGVIDLAPVSVDAERLLLGANLSHQVTCWRLPAGESVTLPDDPVTRDLRATAFCVLAPEPAQARVVLDYSGDQRLLSVTAAGDSFRVDISPAVPNLGSGATWIGPVVLWNRPCMVSVTDDVRLWYLDDMIAAIDAAPRRARDLFVHHTSRSFGAVAVAGNTVWAGSAMGRLHALGADEGQARVVERELHDDTAFIAPVEGVRDSAVVVVTKGGTVEIHDLDGTVPLVAVEVGASVLGMAAAQTAVGAILALSTVNAARLRYGIRLWRVIATGQCGCTLEAAGRFSYFEGTRISAVALFDWNGRSVLAASQKSVMPIWDVATGERLVVLETPAYLTTVGLTVLGTGRGVTIVGGSDDGDLWWYDLADGRLSRIDRAVHRGHVRVAAVAWGQSVALATGGTEGVLRLWSHAGTVTDEVRIGAAITGIASLPGGGVVVSTRRGIVAIDGPAPREQERFNA